MLNCLFSNPARRLAVLTAITICLSPLGAVARPLVDCSKPEFKSMNSARSLYLWTSGAEELIKKAKSKGVFGVEDGSVTGDAVGVSYCPKMIGKRGAAHCKEPNNAEYRTALARLMAVCADAAKPTRAGTSGPVDCADKNFTHPEASVDQLLSWAEMALRGLDSLQPHEGFRVKVQCDRALKNAGTAYCKVPTNPKTKVMIATVQRRCASVRHKRAADDAKQEAAAQAQIAAQKANRRVVRFPRSTFRGGGAGALAAAMKRALLANRLAKAPAEVLKVQPMGRWKSGRYTDTKRPYKKITGLVLWHDKDNDGVCRFVSYNFAKQRAGGGWSPLKVQSFCNGCLEGWTRCK